MPEILYLPALWFWSPYIPAPKAGDGKIGGNQGRIVLGTLACLVLRDCQTIGRMNKGTNVLEDRLSPQNQSPRKLPINPKVLNYPINNLG